MLVRVMSPKTQRLCALSQSHHSSTAELQNQLRLIHHQFANSLWRSFALLALIGVPLSVFRAVNTGWLHLYSVHLFIGASFVIGYFFYNRMSIKLKGSLLILLFWLIGFPSSVTFGFSSSGIWWLILSCLVAHVLFRTKVAIALAVATLLSILIIASGFISGYLSLPFSSSKYLADPTTWATYLLVNLIAFYVVVRCFISYNASLQATTQHQFRQWIDDLPLGIVVQGSNNQPYYSNQAAKDLLGAKPHQPQAYVAGSHESYPALQMPAVQALQGKTCKLDDMEIEQAGQRRAIQAWGRPGYNAEGELIFGISVYEDISDRKQLDLLKNHFVSTVSHELRTPLTSIHGALGLVLGNALGEPEPKIRAMLEIAEQNSQRLIRLINDILDMQKVEAGQMSFHLTRLQLAPWLTNAIKQLEGYALKHQVHFELTPVVNDVWLYADPNRLMQVLANILSNAAKFSPANATVHISVELFTDFVRIAIKDHGSGIEDKFKSVIFRPFSQSDTSDIRRFGGTGLGLSISKSIVEQHGGTLWFESSLGKGSTFFIDLKLGSEHIVNG